MSQYQLEALGFVAIIKTFAREKVGMTENDSVCMHSTDKLRG